MFYGVGAAEVEPPSRSLGGDRRSGSHILVRLCVASPCSHGHGNSLGHDSQGHDYSHGQDLSCDAELYAKNTICYRQPALGILNQVWDSAALQSYDTA